ncbi:histidine phosphatase family protein [Halobacillus litoralis]|uniref:histidine phosphatase family protein n=1 Tax=Halobacillus litoralis TaxID=45668 RepID=UPI001CFDCFA3|nr:histidine phosphatase family protein [Halobacillus litoralis]
MELIFVRHAQGEHTINPPDSLHHLHPSLTSKGRSQAEQLQSELPLTSSDLLVLSPMKRTIETAMIWSEGSGADVIISPMADPRMFPQKPGWEALPCDQTIEKSRIEQEFYIDDFSSTSLWEKGINRMPGDDFQIAAESFLNWLKNHGKERVCMVSHDGTITSFREIIQGCSFTRKDFLTDGGWVREEW